MPRTRRDLEAEIVRLSTIVDQLQGRLDGLDGGSSNGHDGNKPSSRRDLLKMAGAAVAGAAGGLLLNGVPAAAADGQNVVLGNTNASPAILNDAAHTTSLTATTTGGPTPLVKVVGPNSTGAVSSPGPTLTAPLQSFGAIPAGAATGFTPEGIDGWAPGGTGAGLVGASDMGWGVLGETGSGIDLGAYGTGRVFQFSITDNLGGPIAGPPSFTPAQPPNLPGGEFVRDANGVLWASNPSGVGALGWRRVNTTRVDSADGSTFFQPVRIIDTRYGIGGVTGMRAANTSTTWGPFNGTNGIPVNAIGIVGNVTVTGFSGQGFLAIFPAGANYNPSSSPSNMNYTTAWAWANAFTVGFGVGSTNGGKITIYTGFIATHVIVDVMAYLQ